jgi:uncharacterized membrane protein YeaQ/YmgE (transglycosylase-associated protein family)
MSIIGFILLGLLAGAIAKALLPGDQPGGVVVTALIGMAGALVGGLLASAAGLGGLEGFFDLQTWLVAIGGAILLLVVWGAATGRKRRDIRT